ncbi:hypothetical protein B0I27_109110 [Arcticibacter pallidicorallinus]|uniref:Uncharacterized protein n=1 Tax=Arcticibacter pallidicorallinus TaxID=1259464 RepID=A0A2T0TXG7_9SPHI|nr:hypothetical protein [Arcticibacter pallidicorallinus]PRY50387.1 hypothetical protein B0I27_109110 [Arcticibacter pallidicorallinus]
MENQEILSLGYIRQYLEKNYAGRRIKSITPYSFTVGSDHNNEGLQLHLGIEKALFYGHLYLSINPNDKNLQEEKIVIKYRSYFNHTPYFKHITRFVEKENLINESSSSIELFDSLEIAQQSTKYDFYFTFIGFKIDFI